jgi:GR25 family glycosyltransferase involved in LPS biosynthesis
MNNILNSQTFVIHLSKKNPNRYNFFYNNIKNAGYKNINIFEGVNGSNISEVSQVLELFGNPKINNKMSGGQLGCLLSHLKLYKYIIDNKIDIANVFEDDVIFHPEWNKLSQEYYNDTPKDFDILFIGNQIYNHTSQKINKEPCFCTHAYIITLDGAKKIYDMLLNYQLNIELNEFPLNISYDGIFVIDIFFYQIQKNINEKKINPIYKWYCWNGLYYECEHNKLPLKGEKEKNSGLVFQSSDFILSTNNN